MNLPKYLQPLVDNQTNPDQKFGAVARETLEHVRRTPHDKEDLAQFIAFAASRAKSAKGQLFQDLWALWESDNKQGGYFVEFGAGDGIFLSNTYYLEKAHGWTGILAEPNPRSLDLIKQNRTCTITGDCVYTKTGHELTFLAASNPEFSRLEAIVPEDSHEKAGRREIIDRVTVTTVSLNDLLSRSQAPRDIDFLSIDTEGSELAILEAFDFSDRKIRCISVEHNGTPQRAEIYKLLSSYGYERKWESFTWFDDWYVLRR